jgi:hypothetical protein
MSDHTRFPDLSHSGALADDQPAVVLNGMNVVFDEKVALYPVHLEHQRGEERPGDARPLD